MWVFMHGRGPSQKNTNNIFLGVYLRRRSSNASKYTNMQQVRLSWLVTCFAVQWVDYPNIFFVSKQRNLFHLGLFTMRQELMFSMNTTFIADLSDQL